jgi:hypothetical protein
MSFDVFKKDFEKTVKVMMKSEIDKLQKQITELNQKINVLEEKLSDKNK